MAGDAPSMKPAWAPSAAPELLERRARATRAIRGFFDAQRFVEVETPALVPSPGLELHLDALEVSGARARRFLHTSPEYHMKRLLAAGMPRIYQLCKVYRSDEHGSLHEPEFTMLEWYRAHADFQQVMQDTERLVASVAEALSGDSAITGKTGPIDLAPPWERLSVHEAFERYAGVRVDSLLPDEESFYRVLIERVEPALGRNKPTFLTHYPASMASLARLSRDDPSVAERFEAYVDGIELCNGFSELTDASEQRTRFEADLVQRRRLGKPPYPIDERFLAALEHGMPEAAGNALGVDRLLMLLLGEHDVSSVIAFSADRA
ncbi:MAG: EF-P lysine aminoacylase EpmA [Polyangiales bacterium]